MAHGWMWLAVALIVAAAATVIANSASRGSPSYTSVLAGTPRPISLPRVRQAIDALYRQDPAITTYDVSGVEYSPKSRDRVLHVCTSGSIATNPTQLEAERVMACAPLIYCYASCGRQYRASEATDVARQLYWYAATNNRTPHDMTAPLTSLLHSWGIR
jgi:hypothetical protein